MSLEFARKKNISLRKKNEIYTVIAVDEKSLKYNKEKIDQQTEETRLQIELHMHNMQFDIIIIR